MTQTLKTFQEAAAEAVDGLTEPGFYEVAEVASPAAALLLAHALVVAERTLLVLTPEANWAEELVSDLRVVLGDEVEQGDAARRVYPLPAWDILPYEEALPDRELVGERMAALAALRSGEPCIVVAPLRSALQKTLPVGHPALLGMGVEAGQTWERDELVEALLAAGYRRVDVVEEVGECAVRGGIVDAYPPLADLPVRVELDGDQVASLRTFDPSDQRSVEPLAAVHLWPAREDGLVGPITKIAAERLKKEALELGVARRQAKELVERLEEGQPTEEAAFLMPLLTEGASSLFDHLPPSARVCLFNPGEFGDRIDGVWDQAEKGWRLAREAKRLACPPAELYLTGDDLFRAARERAGWVVSNLPPEGEEAGVLPLRSASPETFFGRLEAFGRWAAERARDGERVGVLCINEASAGRLQGVLSEYDLNVPVLKPFAARGPSPLEALEELPQLALLVGRLSAGVSLPVAGVHLVTEEELFGVRKIVRRRRLRRAEAAWFRAAELSPGDFVVHADYGIGCFRGLEAVPVKGDPTECLVLEYAEGDRVFVPLEQFRLVERFVGADGEPALARLGTAAWERTKKRVKAAARELAEELLGVAAKRAAAEGIAFSPDGASHREFAAAFPYEETEDQARVIEEVVADMESPRPTDRLVCGDVGYGKTEVAMRAAFKAVYDGRQVAVLVPTTVLAAQHYQTFRARFAAYPVNIGMLSRFLPRARQKAVVEGLASGGVDLVIGTHRLFQGDVAFANLGLLIIDEEQRFGVAHKERLKKMRSGVDVLTMTATPIPRTLHMALAGIRDLSVIDTPPEDRLAIKTYIKPFDPRVIEEAIGRELARGGQVFVVHNRVETIETFAEYLRGLVPHARVVVAHGQMSERTLERAMVDFLDRAYDVLLCTTIIENGLDIPSVNTIIIDRADRMGLGQLYQLRGRVGRDRHQAYAYLLVPPPRALTGVARQRLRAVGELTALGSGLRLAARDMEIRGAGNVLGPEQSGHVAAVGFELYCRLLAEAVAEIKGEDSGEAVEPTLSLPRAGAVPTDYLPSPTQRLEIYARLGRVRTLSALDALSQEVLDRYGPPPPPVEALFDAVSVRLAARRLVIEAVEDSDGRVTLTLAPSSPMLGGPPPTPEAAAGLPWRAVPPRGLVWDGTGLAPRERLQLLRKSLQAMVEFGMSEGTK